VSLINKMLRDIDRRTADSAPESAAMAQAQRPVDDPASRRPVFLAVAGIALAIALGAAVWAAWRLKPSKLMSEVAFQQAAEAQKPKSQPAPVPAPRPAAPAPAPTTEAPSAAPAPLPAQTKNVPTAHSPPAPEPPARPRASFAANASAQRGEAADPAKRASQQADKKFAQAVALLNKGRVSEAEEELTASLEADPNQAAARQAYIALLLEQGRTDAARRLLKDALKRDPAQPMFALALARIDAQQRNFASALEVMDQAGAAASAPDFQALRGAVYQRMGRNAEAVQAYQNAVANGGQPAQTWIGLAISLEALGRREEAAQAYRRGMAGGELPREVRDYAEARLRAVD
jgi:predicted negative regulator of RcsB-dependent stress response